MSREDKYYDIEKIIGKKFIKGKIYYRVKWKGYPMKESTWEPQDNVKSAIYALDEYERTHPKKQKPKIISNTNTISEIEQDKSNMVNGNEENMIRKELNEKNEIKEFKEMELVHKIDKSFIKVINVRRMEDRLMVLVDKEKENGELVKAYISTEELGRINPWILLDYYESKIKFVKHYSYES